MISTIRGLLCRPRKWRNTAEPLRAAQNIAPKLKRNGEPILTEAVLLRRGMRIYNRDEAMAQVYAMRHMKAPNGVCSDG